MPPHSFHRAVIVSTCRKPISKHIFLANTVSANEIYEYSYIFHTFTVKCRHRLLICVYLVYRMHMCDAHG